jgi:chromosome segregation ATPase
MEVLDQVKETVENVVSDVKSNVSQVQEKAEDQMGKAKENYKSTVDALKGELNHQAQTLKGYQERISTKFNKHINTKEIVADLKEEVEIFTNELKSSVERIKEAFKK